MGQDHSLIDNRFGPMQYVIRDRLKHYAYADAEFLPLCTPGAIDMYDMNDPKIMAVVYDKRYSQVPWSKTSYFLGKSVGYVGQYLGDGVNCREYEFYSADLQCEFQHIFLKDSIDEQLLSELRSMSKEKKRYKDDNSELYVVVGIYTTKSLTVNNYSTSNKNGFVFALDLIKI